MNHLVIEDTVTASERNLRVLGNAMSVEQYDTFLICEKRQSRLFLRLKKFRFFNKDSVSVFKIYTVIRHVFTFDTVIS